MEFGGGKVAIITGASRIGAGLVEAYRKHGYRVEWHAATKRGATFISGRNIAFAIAFVGMTLESCTADECRRFLAGMPPQKRLLVRLFARRARARYRAG